MTLNYNLHGKEIEEAYRRASDSANGDQWVIYEYVGQSNTLKVGEEGTGLEEFSESFGSGKLQFGVIAVRLSADVIPKIVLIHWQGEGVPTLRLAATTSHLDEFKRFLKTVHIVIHARNEIDVEPDEIRKEVLKLPAANASKNAEATYSLPGKVESVYKPTKPHIELGNTARDDFWSKTNEEEKKRQNEEKASRAAQQKQYEEDRQRTANQLSSQAEGYQPEKVNSVYKPVKPHVELKNSEREEFWSKMNEEEKKRQAEEKVARDAQQKQYEADRQRTAQEIHTQAENYQPEKVTSVYKPVKPHVELKSSEREEFWNKMNEEEKRRQAEEKESHEAKQKEFESDRKRIADDLHSKMQIHQEHVEKTKTDASSLPSNGPIIAGGLVGSRKEIFSNKDSSPIAPKPVVSSNGGGKKWPPVATNRDNDVRDVVNRSADEVEEPKHSYVPEPMKPAPTHIEPPRNVYTPEVMKPAPQTYDAYEEPPAEPAPAFVPAPAPVHIPTPPVFTPQPVVAPPPEPSPPTTYHAPPAAAPSQYSSMYDAPPEIPEEPDNSYQSHRDVPPAHIASQYDMPPVMMEEPKAAVAQPKAAPVIDQYDFPPVMNESKALALWDYQAADDTEISFDPDDVITEIDQVDSGWWKGKAPNGRIGLFPANYVKLI